MTPEQRVHMTYEAFNERDESTALAGLASDVHWDDGGGHMLTDKQSIAGHWREQWQNADAKILIDSMHWDGPELILLATLKTKNSDGTRASRTIRNTLQFSGELISSMTISMRE
jgi:hypothetical protein